MPDTVLFPKKPSPFASSKDDAGSDFSTLDPWERAAKHPICRDSPAVDFFEGALLGNGALGAVVCTRPDAVVIHFGHNNVWDVRISESSKDQTGTFQEIFGRIAAIPASYKSLREDKWYDEYYRMTRADYAKPYPRPFPCGSLLLGFDRRQAEILGHRVDISTGLCEVRFLVDRNEAILEIFIAAGTDQLWMRMLDEKGNPYSIPIFDRVRLIPDPKTPPEFPAFSIPKNLGKDALAFRQTLPFLEPHEYDVSLGHPGDRAFSLAVKLNSQLESRTRFATWTSVPEDMGPLERGIVADAGLILCVRLNEGIASDVSPEVEVVTEPTSLEFRAAFEKSKTSWRDFWNRSGIALDDAFLEGIWYWNLYFLNCSVKPDVTCPGLFANWSYGDIGTAWHGDYHMNYNTQQPFWVTFSSNHVDKNLPYVDLVERVLPLERKWAREYYGLRGAYGMHSLYPVEMTTNPFSTPSWGWEICETPWKMQGLWWHYTYTQDVAFLEHRAFEPIKEAVLFLVDYMKRPDAHGPQWGDDKYHIFPTVPPELYELRPGFQYNSDCLVDLTLTKFLFKAYLQACEILVRQDKEARLMEEVRDILGHFPEYPTAASKIGAVFVTVAGEDPEIVQNTPDTLMTVFPGEEHGLHSPAEQFDLCVNSLRNHRNEGGNELVFFNLQAARLGCLDLEKFKRQIKYCLMPNSTCANKCLQVHGRYNDLTSFDHMARMGVWFENFAVPVVINECLFQSYNGTLRFFPNWPAGRNAEFRTLRAAGGFLVSAKLENGEVSWIEIHSESASTIKIILPWGRARISNQNGCTIVTESYFETDTFQGEILKITKG